MHLNFETPVVCRPAPDTGAVFMGEGAVAQFGTRGIPVVSPISM